MAGNKKRVMTKMLLRTALLASFICVAVTPACRAGGLSVDWAPSDTISIESEVAEAQGYFRMVDLPRLSQEAPLKGAAVLGAAACLERVRRAAENKEKQSLEGSMRELAARVNVLRDGKTLPGKGGLFDLLNLTAGGNAQVTVDYYYYGSGMTGAVVVYCGSLPLVSAIVYVNQMPTRKKAIEAFKKYGSSPVLVPAETRLGKYDALVTRGSFAGAMFADYDPAEHYIYVSRERKAAYIVGTAHRPDMSPDAVVITPGCPETVAAKVKTYARKGATGTVPKTGDYIIAGPLSEKEWGKHAQRMLMALAPAYADKYNVMLDKRSIEIRCASSAAVERLASLIDKLAPVTEEDVEYIRKSIVATFPAGTAPRVVPDGVRLFFGDVHAHSYYSDGAVSPQGLALQAIAAYQDFLVITDHNAIDGGFVAAAALKRRGFDYSVIAGDEVSTKDAHFNAYPLKSLISPELSPSEVVREGHAQGAVVQWNHPDVQWAGWAVAQYPRLLEGTSLDAWEHVPWRYPDWKRAGKAPLIVGSSDTHDGMFSDSDRTGVFAAAPTGSGIADAIRTRRAIAAWNWLAGLFCGDDVPVGWAVEALRDGAALKARKIQHLKDVMKRADLMGLLQDSSPSPKSLVVVTPVGKVRERGRIGITVKVANTWHDGEVKAVVSLVPGQGSWEKATVETVVPANSEKTVTLDTRAGKSMLPLPVVVADLYEKDEKFMSLEREMGVIPETPGEAAARSASSMRVVLSWTDRSVFETGYRIERKDGTGRFEVIGTVGADVTVYSDSGLESGAKYAYRIQAFNATGPSEYSSEVDAVTPAGPGALPRSLFKVLRADSEETNDGDGRGVMAIDGKSETIWHTEWSSGSPAHPHEIQIDLGKEYQVSGLEYLPRQDGKENGNIAAYKIFTSRDGKKWGNPVASGTWDKTPARKETLFTPGPARYVRLVAESEVNGNPWTSAAEIGVIGE